MWDVTSDRHRHHRATIYPARNAPDLPEVPGKSLILARVGLAPVGDGRLSVLLPGALYQITDGLRAQVVFFGDLFPGDVICPQAHDRSQFARQRRWIAGVRHELRLLTPVD